MWAFRPLRTLLAIGVAALHTAAAPAQPNPAGYVGAPACRACHPAQFAQQSASEHARSLFPAAEHPLAGSFASTGELLRPPNFRFRFQLRAN